MDKRAKFQVGREEEKSEGEEGEGGNGREGRERKERGTEEGGRRMEGEGSFFNDSNWRPLLADRELLWTQERAIWSFGGAAP